MSKKFIERFGRKYLRGTMETSVEDTLEVLISAEIDWVVALKLSEDLTVREDLLVMFVEMYTRRFALPAFLLTHRRGPRVDELRWVLSRLYMCMVGRAVDDLSDGDSKMFSLQDSQIIYTRYLDRLEECLGIEFRGNFVQLLMQSSWPPDSERSISGLLDLKNDVIHRICYFVDEYTDGTLPRDIENFHRYVTVLLSYLDLNDVIADGPDGPSSTRLSRAFWFELTNDEGKILIDARFIATWCRFHNWIAEEGKMLAKEARLAGLEYVSHILLDANQDGEWVRAQSRGQESDI